MPVATASPGPPEQKGRLSNPVQRRLSDVDSAELLHRYRAGESIDGLARERGDTGDRARIGTASGGAERRSPVRPDAHAVEICECGLVGGDDRAVKRFGGGGDDQVVGAAWSSFGSDVYEQ
jgi:hypothetical protein